MLQLVNKMPTDNESKNSNSENMSTGLLLLKFWPIVGAAVFAVLSIGGIYVKVDYIAEAIKRNDQLYANINDRQNLAGQSIIEIRGQVANIANENSRNSQAISNLNERVNVIVDKTRWMQK